MRGVAEQQWVAGEQNKKERKVDKKKHKENFQLEKICWSIDANMRVRVYVCPFSCCF
jgi:hypothetical protein